jgi:histidine ammonia-lyase
MKNNAPPLELNGENLNLARSQSIAIGRNVSLAPSVKKRVDTAARWVKKLSQQKNAVYGVNTGYGFLANTAISPDKLLSLQSNLIKSHASGFGEPLSIAETRLAMTLRLNVFLRGHTGVRWRLCQALADLINHEIYPVIPSQGSVGASGDLAPLAHLALPLIGLGSVFYKGKKVPAMQALKSENLKAIRLQEKEGLGLINGTQIMLAVGGSALARARHLLKWSTRITALSFEGLGAHVDALSPLIHEARGHPGQIQVANSLVTELEGSYLWNKRLKRKRVQDPYSLRCSPQVHGPSHEALDYAIQVIEREMNAVTDNPLMFSEEERIISGGNFHGQPIALAFDFASIGLAEMGNISERRLELLLNPHYSYLTPFLASNPGLESGYMAMQYLSASLVNENKLFANPSSTDSIPGNIGIEDHVSMGMTSAKKLRQITCNLKTILACEWLAAVQAIDLRKVSDKLSVHTRKTYELLRASVPMLQNDRIISDDVEKAVAIITSTENEESHA